MSQDLSYIRTQLKNCEEVDSPFDIKIGQNVKYITLKNDSEYFFDGGEYIKMGDNQIVLKIGSKYEYIKLIHYNKAGYTVYRTRLFVVDSTKDIQNGGGNKTIEEYEKIIKTQQEIIEKLNIQLKKQHTYIMNIQNNQ